MDVIKMPENPVEDVEYRELETTEEVATSQPVVSAYGLEKPNTRKDLCLPR